jgi:hypothetical protein
VPVGARRFVVIAISLAVVACTEPSGPGWQALDVPAAMQPMEDLSLDVVGDGTVMASGGLRGPDGELSASVWRLDESDRWVSVEMQPLTPDGRRALIVSIAGTTEVTAALGAAYGALHGNLRPVLWSGPEDGPLVESPLPRELFGGPRIIAVAEVDAGPGDFVVAGSWTSETGALGREEPSRSSTRRERLTARSVVIGPTGAIIVGTACHIGARNDLTDAAAWWSRDGTSWTRADGLDRPRSQDLVPAVALDHGYAAVGSDGDDVVVWCRPTCRSGWGRRSSDRTTPRCSTARQPAGRC